MQQSTLHGPVRWARTSGVPTALAVLFFFGINTRAVEHSGTVTDGGAGASGVRIRYDWSGNPGYVTTDGNGRWSSPGWFPGQWVRFTAEQSGYNFSGPHEFTTGLFGRTDLNFTRSSSISGKVTLANGTAVGEVTIIRGTSTSLTKVSDGTYSFTGLSQGTYTLTATKAGLVFRPANLVVTIGPSKSDQNFTVANPMATTLPATNVAFGGAVLNGFVIGEGTMASRAWFEYGIGGNFSSTTSVQVLSPATNAVLVSAIVTNLSGGLIYNYRLIAANNVSTNYGSSLSFRMPFPAAGSAVNFDGSNDYVVVGTNPVLRVTTNLTIEAWINPMGPGSGANGIGGVIAGREGEYLLARFSDGTIQYALANTSVGWRYTNTGVVVPTNRWTHIAFTYDANAPTNRIVLYTNGVLASTRQGAGPIGDALTTHNEFLIGRRQHPDDPQFFHGQIDEVRIWNVARTEPQITNNFQRRLTVAAEPRLVAYFQFDEGVNTTTTDNGPNALSATLTNGASFVVSGALIRDPVVTTRPASPVLATTATLRGEVIPSGDFTTAFFEYGTSLSSLRPVSAVLSPNAGLAPVAVSATITNLEPGTPYFFRLRAINSFGATIGLTETFTTLVLGFGWPISTKVTGGDAWAPKHIVDPDGNVYLAGLFTVSATFNSTLNAQGGGGTNAFIARLARGADWSWAANIPLSAAGTLRINAIALDSANNVYVAGQFSGTATFGANNLTAVGGTDIFVAKLDRSGTNWLWARSVGGATNDSATALAVAPRGDLYVAGQFARTNAFGSNILVSSNNTPDIFVAKIDPNGNWQWASAGRSSAANDIARALVVDSNENIYTAGEFAGTAVFSPAATPITPLSSIGGGQDLFVAKLDRSGNWLLARRGGSSGNDTATALSIDALNQLYLLCLFSGTADYGSRTNLNSAGGANLVVLKLDTSFTLSWDAQGGVGFADSIAVDRAAEQVYISGEFAFATTFGATSLNTSGNSDVFLAQLGAGLGEWRWARQIGSTGNEFRGSIAVDAAGGVVVSGSYQNTIQIGDVALTSPNNQDIFVARLDAAADYEHNNFIIGQAIPVPVDAQDPDRNDGGARGVPGIQILRAEIPGSDQFNSFFWSDPEHRLFAIRPVTAIFKWPLTSDPANTNLTRVATVVGRNFWPEQMQLHVAGAPAEVQGPGVGLGYSFGFIHFETNKATVIPVTRETQQFQILQATNPGLSVVRFSKPGGEAVFEVLRTLPPQQLWTRTNEPALIGSHLRRRGHFDPTGKNGFVYFEKALYDGAGEERAYDRSVRTGPIIPVNTDTDTTDDLVVVWYHTNANTGIAWPDDPVYYQASWPSDAAELVLASGAGSGTLDPALYPSKRVYIQSDTNQPGFNPNEEHAALYGDVLYALRNDLNSIRDFSAPYTLLKYRDPDTGEWVMKVFKVVATDANSQFVYSGTVGKELLPPAPLSLLPLCGVSNTISSAGFKDHQGRLYARAAGPTNSAATITTRYWYPLQPGFFYDLDGKGQPNGGCVPWLDRLHGGKDKPVDVTYNITWPTDIPSLQIGETLTTAKFGLPQIRDFAHAQIIFDEANPKDTNALGSLVRLFDPLSERSVQLPDDFDLPDDIATVLVRGRRVFVDLPYAIRARLSYDPLSKRLIFGGLYDDSGAGEPLLLINVLSSRERERIKDLNRTDDSFTDAVEALYNLTRNPNQVDADRDGNVDDAVRVGLTTQTVEGNEETLVTSVILRVGSSPLVTYRTSTLLTPKSDGTYIIHEPLGDLPKALTAGSGAGSGYVTIVENNDSRLSGLPVTLHVIRIDGGPFRGDLKVLYPDNLFDEKLTLRHSADFGGEPEKFEFEWYYQGDSDGSPDLPVVRPDGSIDLRGWIKFENVPPGANGFNDITIGDGGTQSSLLTISDNWIICRYRGYAVNGQTNWSNWVGGPGGGAQLAEGWIKRVLDGLDPFETRVKDFHQAPTATFASMILQAGERYEGPIAFNPDPANLNKLGLIAAYETVLDRGRALSIDALPPVNYNPANNALLLAAGRIADLYMLLGNEGYADASDPTIGLTTVSGVYGNLAPSIFSFQNQLDSFLEEELVLLRGRDNSTASVRARPVYNRLFWNFTGSDGEVAYSQNYNISDQNVDGVIDEKDARILFPQGHGDAWGHYLTATKKYYDLLRHPFYQWKPRSESVLVAGEPTPVDYLDERKFARAAAAKAKVGGEIVNLTYRSKYVEDPAGQWQGYKDTDAERAWGFDEWARRAGSGALFDWITANAVLPATDPNPTNTGIQKIDRTTVTEMDEIAAQYSAVQSQVDKADAGLNPLGLATGVVPFDIDPAKVSSGQTHFDQIYQRSLKTLDNAIALFNHANTLSQNLRRNQDSVEQFTSNAADKERDYKNRLIEIFGYPYVGDIGAAGTYPSGYDGPDLYHYMYVNATDLTGEKADVSDTNRFTGYFKPLSIGSSSNILFLFQDDVQAPSSLPTDNILQVSFPISEGGAYQFTAPAAWGQRRAPGKLQSGLADILKAEAKLKQSLVKYNNLRLQIQDTADLLEAQEQFLAKRIRWKVGEGVVLTTLSGFLVASKGIAEAIKGAREAAKAVKDGTAETLPKTVGTSSDVFAPVRGAIHIAAFLAGAGGIALETKAIIAQESFKEAKDLAKNATAIRLEFATANYELQQKIKALEQLIRTEAPARLELYELQEALQQANGNYLNTLAQGERLLEERLNFRKTTAARTQEYRYQDMAFRIFQNDAIQKYRAQFDLAALYTYLAAKAYDYETCLLGTDSGAGRKFLTDIVRHRSLGQVVSGQPISGRHGLADPLARLSQNFEVYRGQLGFTTPETETGRFSLRSELFRLRGSSDAEWRAELKRHQVDDLWAVPEFRRFCRPFAPEGAGAQPGLVISFETTITFGLNYFTHELGARDSAYDPSRFATKVRSAGVWFSGYNQNQLLSLTPRVYLVPAGQDILRSPSGNTLETREWTVVDQKLPVPFPIGASDLDNPAWIPGNDSLSETFADIRRFSTFRAYHDDGFKESEATIDTRLIGRSVWNTKWMLIIPGGTFLSNPQSGLDTFINTVSDIKIFFQTYAYSGN